MTSAICLLLIPCHSIHPLLSEFCGRLTHDYGLLKDQTSPLPKSAETRSTFKNNIIHPSENPFSKSYFDKSPTCQELGRKRMHIACEV